MPKPLFISQTQLQTILQTHPTPFHLYNEVGIRQTMRQMNTAFAWNDGFMNYFAVKATPNPTILHILQEEGSGFDCSSLTELILMERLGVGGNAVMLTSNNTAVTTFQKARQLNAIINLDDINHLPFLETHASLPPIISFRYNPGALKSGNLIIGHPQESKFGVTREQLFAAYALAKEKGIGRFGLHTMVASNELDGRYFVETAVLLFSLIAELSQKLNIRFDFVNLGGGIGIPYRPEETAVDIQHLSKEIEAAYNRIIVANGLAPMAVIMECGRFITGPHAILVTAVQHIKESYKRFVGLDASMHNLMRPALYGAYHHITPIGKEQAVHSARYDITGSLCENNDKFAINRALPEMAAGDIVAIHDTGAHGYAMGFNYNGQLRSAELLWREDETAVLIRRAETVEDYFQTMIF